MVSFQAGELREFRGGLGDQRPVDHTRLEPAPARREAQPAGLNPVKSAERDALLQVLRQAHWNVSTVAKQLGVARNTLYRKLERLNIDLPGVKKATDEQ